MDGIHQPSPGSADSRREYGVGPATVGHHHVDPVTVNQSPQSAACTQDRPRTAQPDAPEVVDGNTRRDELIANPPREAETEVWFHLPAEVTQTGERQEVGLDPPEEVSSRQVQDFHAAVPITAR
jgi:hypothetical protein